MSDTTALASASIDPEVVAACEVAATQGQADHYMNAEGGPSASRTLHERLLMRRRPLPSA
jgi:hypothetical protein